MKISTSELAGPALDWAVAKCEGFTPFTDGISWIIDRAGAYEQLPRYSTDWAQGGPLIERENICLRGVVGGFHAWYHQMPPKMFGTSMLIAAMRCYVTSKLGDEIDVPEELT